MKSIFTLLLFTFVFGCGFKQDPLDGRDGSIQNAIPPTQEKPDPAKPVQSDIVRIDSVKFFSFLEGRKDELTIQSRFLGKDHETRVEIENIVDFPGASFDQSTGKFSWTPSLGTVLGSDMYSQMSLKAVVFAIPAEGAEDQTVYTTRQDILVIINRTKKVPEIVSVSAGFPDSITENDSSNARTFTVTVRDSDSVDGNINQPRLAILPAQKTIQKNFSPYLRIIRSTQSSVDPSLWDFTLGIEISKSELTISRDVYGVSFQAYSAFGIASVPIEKTMTVYNDMAQAMTNQTDDFVVDPLVTTQLTFFVFDPKNEGSLVIDPLRFNLPKNATLVCKSKTPSLSVCVLTVVPAKEQANSRMLATLLVKNTNTMDDSKYKTSSISIKIQVNKLPPPPPPPTPEPPAPPVNPPAPESPEVPNPSQPVQP